MKNLLLFSMMCLLALTMRAQRCAVMEFTAGAGISQSDVDGISAIFMTYFRPEGYTMVERTEIDKAIEEQQFQRSSMTERQKVRVGEILNVSKIVVGVVNVVMGQYNVDVRVPLLLEEQSRRNLLPHPSQGSVRVSKSSMAI